jgi:hypothetical protein
MADFNPFRKGKKPPKNDHGGPPEKASPFTKKAGPDEGTDMYPVEEGTPEENQFESKAAMDAEDKIGAGDHPEDIPNTEGIESDALCPDGEKCVDMECDMLHPGDPGYEEAKAKEGAPEEESPAEDAAEGGVEEPGEAPPPKKSKGSWTGLWGYGRR